MNGTCKATTNGGTRCRAVAVKDGLCALHANPRLAAEMGRKSGKARRYSGQGEQPQSELEPPRTAQDVRDALAQVISDVRGRRLDPKVASTIGYLASVLLKALEERLAALETVLKTSAR